MNELKEKLDMKDVMKVLNVFNGYATLEGLESRTHLSKAVIIQTLHIADLEGAVESTWLMTEHGVKNIFRSTRK